MKWPNLKKAKTNLIKINRDNIFQLYPNEANLNNQKSAYLVLGIKNDKSIVGTAINDVQIIAYKAEIVRIYLPT